MKSEILSALRQSEGYISGQELCERFGVSRTAVWKGINQLKNEGYQIEAVQNKGYRLCGYPDSISKTELESRMHTRWVGKNLICLDSVDSTNDYIKKLAEEGAPHGTLAVADYQSGGKGRRGRAWVTPHGSAIAMSILVRPQLAPEKASMMTLVAGMAVAKSVKEVTGLDVKIKWPNDVVIRGKKISGTLTEMSMELGAIHYIVIGTGINANVTEFPEEIQDIATSLILEKGEKVDRAAIICAHMEAFEDFYDRFMEYGDMTLLREDYQELLVNQNQQVRVLEPGNEYTGIARGIDELGQLLVEKEDGSMVKVYAGEVSVRGIYNYV